MPACSRAAPPWSPRRGRNRSPHTAPCARYRQPNGWRTGLTLLEARTATLPDTPQAPPCCHTGSDEMMSQGPPGGAPAGSCGSVSWVGERGVMVLQEGGWRWDSGLGDARCLGRGEILAAPSAVIQEGRENANLGGKKYRKIISGVGQTTPATPS